MAESQIIKRRKLQCSGAVEALIFAENTVVGGRPSGRTDASNGEVRERESGDGESAGRVRVPVPETVRVELIQRRYAR